MGACRFSGLKGSLSRDRNFVCKTCVKGGRTSMENFEEKRVELEGVNEFEYFYDM